MYDVITIGTATQDVFLTSDEFKKVSDPKHLKKLGFVKGEAECFALGSKIEIRDLVVAYGGGAANAAVTFARQGFKTGALVRVGGDKIGKAVIDNLKEEKIKSLAVTAKKEKSGYSTILYLPSGERTILVYRGAAGGLQKKEVKITKLDAKWVYIAPSEIPLSVIEWIVEYLKKKEVKIVMNPSRYYLNLNKKALYKLLKNIDVVVLNREETSYLTGVAYSKEKQIFRKFDRLIGGVAVMTEGKKGVVVSDGRYLYRAGIYKNKEIKDRTGAGDAFGSAFTAGLMMKGDLGYALKLASANATSVVEDVGAQTGILHKGDFNSKRFKYLDLDIEPLL